MRLASAGPFLFAHANSLNTGDTAKFRIDVCAGYDRGQLMAWQSKILLTLCIAFAACGCAAPTHVADKSEIETPSQSIAHINHSDHTKTKLVNGLSINQDTGEVFVKGNVALRQGFLEQLVCFKGTREHESLVVVNVAASHIHAALLAVGARAGHPGIWSRDKATVNDLKLEPPTGDILGVQVEYVLDGVSHRCDLGEWIEDARHQEKFGNASFVFAGSHFEPDGRGGQRYRADVTGSTVGLVTFGDELVAYAQVIPDQADISQPRWQANTARIPSQGSDVVLIFKAFKP